TDDKALLHQTLAEKTGERIAALEAMPMHQEETIMSPLETTSTPTLEAEKEMI
ncbi:MAG: hypothetical protein GY847_39325, partial [Proteobacteria bacterium]|nr:hypothetical protein [Pseudomonadota bacterium]